MSTKPDSLATAVAEIQCKNTQFVIEILLMTLTTEIMGAKLPGFIIDIPVHCFLNELSLRSRCQIIVMQLQPSLAERCLLVGHLER